MHSVFNTPSYPENAGPGACDEALLPQHCQMEGPSNCLPVGSTLWLQPLQPVTGVLWPVFRTADGIEVAESMAQIEPCNAALADTCAVSLVPSAPVGPVGCETLTHSAAAGSLGNDVAAQSCEDVVQGGDPRHPIAGVSGARRQRRSKR